MTAVSDGEFEQLKDEGKYSYGYQGSAKKVTKTDNNKTYVTRFHITDKLPLTAVNVEKIWDDENDEFALRPSDIADKLTLSRYAASDTVSNPESVSFTELTNTANYKMYVTESATYPAKINNQYTYTYKKILKYDDDNHPYIFKITETQVTAYQAPTYDKQYLNYTEVDPTATDTNGLTALTNALQAKNTLDTREIKVYKHWNDNDNSNNTRYQVNVTLSSTATNNGSRKDSSNKYEELKTIAIQNPEADEVQFVTFEKLPKYDKTGAVIVYNVREDANGVNTSNYNVFTIPSEYITSETAKFTIKNLDNTKPYKIVNVASGTKQDVSVTDGKATVNITGVTAPLLLKLQVSDGTTYTDVANVEVEIVKQSGQTVTLTSQPSFIDGSRKYGYSGSAVYKAEGTTPYATEYHITNTLPQTSVTVTKNWDDIPDQHKYKGTYLDGTDPKNYQDISVKLTRSVGDTSDTGFNETKSIVYDESSMTDTFSNLLVYNEDNAQYTYKVEEEALRGYTTKYKYPSSSEFSDTAPEISAKESAAELVTIQNTPITGDAEVIKIDQNHYDAYTVHSGTNYKDKTLKGVKFALTYNNGTAVNVTKDTNDGKYYIDSNSTSNVVESGDDGTIKFKDFPLNTYTLTETETLTGYKLRTNPVVFKIDVDDANEASATYDSGFVPSNGRVKNRIGNVQTIEKTKVSLVKYDETDRRIRLANATYYLLQMIPYESSGSTIGLENYIEAADEAIYDCNFVLTDESGKLKSTITKYWHTSEMVNGGHIPYIYTTNETGQIEAPLLMLARPVGDTSRVYAINNGQFAIPVNDSGIGSFIIENLEAKDQNGNNYTFQVADATIATGTAINSSDITVSTSAADSNGKVSVTVTYSGASANGFKFTLQRRVGETGSWENVPDYYEYGPITGLMNGRYVFVEVQAPEGYERSYWKPNDSSLIGAFEINNEQKIVRVEHTDPRKEASLNVLKENEYGDPLDGAEFKLYYRPDSVNGLYKFVDEGSNATNYWDTSVSVGSGLNEHPYYLTLINERQADEDDDEPVLDTNSGPVYLATVKTGNDGLIRCITDLKRNDSNEIDTEYLDHKESDLNNEEVKTVKVKKWGKYFWKEVKAPVGYEADKEDWDEFSINAQEADKAVSVFTATDTHKRGKVTLTKTSEQALGDKPIGTALANAKFKLYDNSGNQKYLLKKSTSEYYVAEEITDKSRFSAGNTYLDVTDETLKAKLTTANYELYDTDNGHFKLHTEAITDSEGKLTIGNLDWGQYYLQESDAPDGYVITDTSTGEPNKVNFSVGRNNCDGQQLSCTDEIKPAQLRIDKELEEYLDVWGTPTFIFKIKKLTQTGNTTTYEKVVSMKVDDSVGKKGSTGWIDIEPGEYEVTELNVSRYSPKSCQIVTSESSKYTDKGTSNENRTIKFTVEADGKVVVKYVNQLDYYDKFSHTDVAENKFYGNKSIEVEDKFVKITDNSGKVLNTVEISKSDLAAYWIPVNGKRTVLKETEKQSMTFEYVPQTGDHEDFSITVNDDKIVIDNPGLFAGGVYRLKAKYGNLSGTFDLIIGNKSQQLKKYEKTVIFHADEQNFSYFTDGSVQTSQYEFTFSMIPDGGSYKIYSIRHNGKEVSIDDVKAIINNTNSSLHIIETHSSKYSFANSWKKDNTTVSSSDLSGDSASGIETIVKNNDGVKTVTYTAQLSKS